MFTRFTKEFETSLVVPAISGASLVLSDAALVETRVGWRSPTVLKPGMEIASLDGGFTPLRNVTRISESVGAYFVPAGALDNCTALCLPADARVGMEAPLGFEEATSDTLSLPISALEGHAGIRQMTSHGGQMYRLSFADEEMIWSNTGMLLHAHTRNEGFFHMLDFGQARAFLSLLKSGHYDIENAGSLALVQSSSQQLQLRCA